MLKLLRTVPQWAVRDRPGPEEDRLGLLWGPGGLEVFRLGPQGMNSWRSPGPIPDVTCLRGAIEEALRHLGTPPNRAVMVVLHPEVVQIHVDVPAAAPASVVRTLIQRSFDRQKPVKGSVRWRDVPLASSGESVRRLVYAMPEELYQTIREGLRDHGIELGSMIPFAGLAVLEADADRTSDVAVLEAWHLPVGLAVGLRRGGDFWMVRPLVLIPEMFDVSPGNFGRPLGSRGSTGHGLLRGSGFEARGSGRVRSSTGCGRRAWTMICWKVETMRIGEPGFFGAPWGVWSISFLRSVRTSGWVWPGPRPHPDRPFSLRCLGWSC